jgi:hypothetical protein
MRVQEIITELRAGVLQNITRVVPDWPEYVIKDWLYSYANMFNRVKGRPFTGSDLESLLDRAGLDINTRWRFRAKQSFDMYMWAQQTIDQLDLRAGGRPSKTVPRDIERHATQAKLIQKSGGISTEPVIMLDTSAGFVLVEGWHRTIQHFAKHPDGYVGPAWIADSRY